MMRRRFILTVLATAVASSVMFLWLIIELVHTRGAIQGIASLAINSLAPTPGATATATTQTSSGNGGVLNPTIIAALIGLGGIIVGPLSLVALASTRPGELHAFKRNSFRSNIDRRKR